MSSNDEPRMLSDKSTVTEAERRLKCQNPGPLTLHNAFRHFIESRSNHRPPPPSAQYSYGYHQPPTALSCAPLPSNGEHYSYTPPAQYSYGYPVQSNGEYYSYPPQFSTPPESNVNTGYPVHHLAHEYPAYHPAHHRNHGHYSYGGQYYPPSIGKQPQPNNDHCQPPNANPHATKQPVHVTESNVNTTHEQFIPTVTPCNSNEEQSIPTVHHPTSNGCKRRHLCIEDGTPQQHHPRKQCDVQGCTELRTEVSSSRYCPKHYAGKFGRAEWKQREDEKRELRRAELKQYEDESTWKQSEWKQREDEKRELRRAEDEKRELRRAERERRKAERRQLSRDRSEAREDEKRELRRAEDEKREFERREAERRQLSRDRSEAERRQHKSEENMKMIARQHEESEEREAERHGKREQAIHEIDDLMVLNQIGAIRTKRFSINSQHKWIINLKSISDIESIPRLDDIMKASILESIGQAIGPSKAISIIDISPSKSGKSATVTYQVIPCLPDNDPKTIEEFESVEEICVAPYDLSSSSFDIRYHPSLRPHIIKHGLAMLAFLESRNRVIPLKEPHEVGCDIVSDAFGAGGHYTAWNNLGVMKHGSTKIFYERVAFYEADPKYRYATNDVYGSIGARFQERINMNTIAEEEDAALCYGYDKFVDDVKNDPKVPSHIKRLLCEKIRERGGERLGPKKTLIYQVIEGGLQRKDGLCVIFEGLQYDEKQFYGMIAKVEEAVAAVESIIQHVSPRPDLPVPGMMSWPPGDNRKDQIYNTLCAEDYVGATSKRNAFDGPAIPDWRTQEERYSKEYSIRQFNTANEEIDDFILEAWKLRATGCLFLLNKNELACSKGEKLHTRLTTLDFEKEASIYDDDIEIWRIEKAVVLVHVPLCVGGSIMAHITMKKLQRRCIVIDTIRCIVSMAKGEEVSGPMLAIEAGMAQRLLHNGLHLPRMICAAFFRDYLTPAEVNAFDLYGGSSGGPIKHYLDYPIAKKNRENYIRK